MIKYLQEGNIKKAQEIFGMKKKSSYRSNRASGLMDKYTLANFKDPLFNLSGDGLLNHSDVPQDLKDAYR